MVIGIIGRIDERLCDGQTIKTRVLVEELRRKYPNATFKMVETHRYTKRAWQILKDLLRCMKDSHVVFVLLSRNGMRVIFPLVNFLNLLYRKPIFHDCIGGTLDLLAAKYPLLRRQLKKFDINWVESTALKTRLENMGVNNVEYLPNFKRLRILPEGELTCKSQEPYYFCTFSRVNEAKGIGRAAEAVLQINRAACKTLVALDVYGPIEENYDQMLDWYIEQADGAITYKGVVEYDKSVETLKDYYALLFPTTFQGEGFPGTLIDALSAGVPVIATDWHFNGEIIKEGSTGYLYPVEKPECLRQLMEEIIKDPKQNLLMRKNCLCEASKYDAESVMGVICERIERKAKEG